MSQKTFELYEKFLAINFHVRLHCVQIYDVQIKVIKTSRNHGDRYEQAITLLFIDNSTKILIKLITITLKCNSGYRTDEEERIRKNSNQIHLILLHI